MILRQAHRRVQVVLILTQSKNRTQAPRRKEKMSELLYRFYDLRLITLYIPLTIANKVSY